MSEFTVILDRVQQGDHAAAEKLLPLVYQELRKVAAVMMAGEAQGQTLQPTALVHEAWLRLVGENKEHWAGRPQFFAAAAEAMRRILIENARRKGRIKRGGGWQRINLEGLDVATATDDATLLVVNEALDRLEAQDPMKASLVKLRFLSASPLRNRRQSSVCRCPRSNATGSLPALGCSRKSSRSSRRLKPKSGSSNREIRQIRGRS